MAAKESTIQAAIIRYLRDQGAWVHKNHQSGYGRRGIPDVVTLCRGRTLWLEVKGAEGVVSTDQAREITAIRRAGGLAFVVRSVDEVSEIVHAGSLVDLLMLMESESQRMPLHAVVCA